MSLLNDLYPPNPENIPDDVTKPTPAYKTRVVIVLACLLLFLLLYIAITIGSAYLTYWSFSMMTAPTPPGARKNDNVIWQFFLCVASALVFLYMVKGFFKRSYPRTDIELEVTERDQPALFAFIRRLCRDTNAPIPHRVFLTHEVNAGVIYDRSIWNLVWPTKKNLIIGLALINRLNLSEFKAVLAHEFGHFSQDSMKLGNYVYVANMAIGDIVYGRDWLDRTLDVLSQIDIRITIVIWVLKAIIWVLRLFLGLIFKAINFARSALSRQMEFNADLVAYSVTGSDAIVNGLKKTVFANDALMAAVHDLIQAGDHKLYTNDLFYHQTTSAEYLRRKAKDPAKGEPPPLSPDPTEPTKVFEPDDFEVPLMWATHPSNYDREQNVKARYVRGPIDDRSSWLLFMNAAEVKQELTRQFYEKVVLAKDFVMQPAEKVQAFIDAEHEEMTYDERYHGIYDEGFVGPGDLKVLMPEAGALLADASALDQMQADLFNDNVRKRMEQFRTRRTEQNELFGLANGYVQKKTFKHRDEEHPLKDAKKLLEGVNEELKDDQKWLETFDRDVFKVHYAMALQLEPEVLDELENRYNFHLGVQDVVNHMQAGYNQGQQTLNSLAGRSNLSQDEFQNVVATFRGLHKLLVDKITSADHLKLPELKNMETGQSLGKFLWSKELPPEIGAYVSSIGPDLWEPIFGAYREVMDKGRRITKKSMGGILTLQEAIAKKWRAKRSQRSEPPPLPGSSSSGPQAPRTDDDIPVVAPVE